MKGLVRIRDLETTDAPLLAPAQSYFLRENLKLRLLSARVALLARDEPSFREDLKASQAWIAKYFDVRAKTTAAALAALKSLAESPVVIGVPDINASLAAVRTARAAKLLAMLRALVGLLAAASAGAFARHSRTGIVVITALYRIGPLNLPPPFSGLRRVLRLARRIRGATSRAQRADRARARARGVNAAVGFFQGCPLRR
jgi:hypothetical protein